MKFATEAELCVAFAETLPSAWTPYNETAGFDIVLVHKTGAQIGVEAKKTLNPKVLAQVIETRPHRCVDGPDFRAVLVGGKPNPDLLLVAKALGVTVITMTPKGGGAYNANTNKSSKLFSTPKLPKVEALKQSRWATSVDWFDQCPVDRLHLPEYIPDVPAGVPAPAVLGSWKIQAIKVCVWVETHKIITRAHFKALGIDPGRWMTGYWLQKGPARGDWVAGPSFPLDSFKIAHPTTVASVIEDIEKWSLEAGLNLLGIQEPML